AVLQPSLRMHGTHRLRLFLTHPQNNGVFHGHSANGRPSCRDGCPRLRVSRAARNQPCFSQNFC
ncbi:hypothetical protein, partial [Nitrosococcus oceani]|uniref:hypothetical protein n=1 Tax=Nitrosococcus oceani TaxID=1229 RepID=UPI001C54FA65